MQCHADAGHGYWWISVLKHCSSYMAVDGAVNFRYVDHFIGVKKLNLAVLSYVHLPANTIPLHIIMKRTNISHSGINCQLASICCTLVLSETLWVSHSIQLTIEGYLRVKIL
jgi:hypothetical protein